uniref:Uncharacterized protein n=1 Tax=Chrysemys picta bellii TaxID=8478 RepID=A0A8C3I078_CHRPI
GNENFIDAQESVGLPPTRVPVFGTGHTLSSWAVPGWGMRAPVSPALTRLGPGSCSSPPSSPCASPLPSSSSRPPAASGGSWRAPDPACAAASPAQ